MKFLLCFGLAWAVVNGWAFVCVFLKIEWLQEIAKAWITILIMPNGVGVMVSIPLALLLARVLFPKDKELMRKINKLRKNRVRDLESDNTR